MIKIQNLFSALFFTLSTISTSDAQVWKSDEKINIVFGLTQPLLVNGFNMEGNFIYKRFLVDYSHGISLDFSGTSVTTDLKNQGVSVHMPWTTGFGAGYRLKEWLNIRIEPKWHRFEFYYDGETQNNRNQITAYNTMSLGVGVYGHFQPFKRQNSFLKGFVIAPSIRFWPTINSTLSEEKFSYHNKNTHQIVDIKLLDPGIGFTPVVFNVSIGYSFNLKGK